MVLGERIELSFDDYRSSVLAVELPEHKKIRDLASPSARYGVLTSHAAAFTSETSTSKTGTL